MVVQVAGIDQDRLLEHVPPVRWKLLEQAPATPNPTGTTWLACYANSAASAKAQARGDSDYALTGPTLLLSPENPPGLMTNVPGLSS